MEDVQCVLICIRGPIPSLSHSLPERQLPPRGRGLPAKSLTRVTGKVDPEARACCWGPTLPRASQRPSSTLHKWFAHPSARLMHSPLALYPALCGGVGGEY